MLGWLRRLFPAHRRGVVTKKEGYIRPNVITGGGYYRIRVQSREGEWDLLVADYNQYQAVPEAVPLDFSVVEKPDGIWLRGFRPAQ